jgi:hypothetical protein
VTQKHVIVGSVWRSGSVNRYVLYPVPPQSVKCKLYVHLGFTSFTNNDNGDADYTR